MSKDEKEVKKGGRPKGKTVSEKIQKQKRIRAKAAYMSLQLDNELTPEFIRKAGEEFLKEHDMKILEKFRGELYDKLRLQFHKDTIKIHVAFIIHDKDLKVEDSTGEIVFDTDGKPELKKPHMHLNFWTEDKNFRITFGKLGTALGLVDDLGAWRQINRVKGGMTGIISLNMYLTHESKEAIEDKSKRQYPLKRVCSDLDMADWRRKHPYKIRKKKVKFLEPLEIYDGLVNGDISWSDLGDRLNHELLFKSWNAPKIRTQVLNMFATGNQHIIENTKNMHRDTYFITGDAGTGKTTFAKYLLDKFSDGRYYELVHGNGKGAFSGAFDGYINQKAILADELRPEDFSAASLLTLFGQDNSTRTVQARYSNRVLVNNLTVATTVTDVRRFWDFVGHTNNTAGEEYQFFRRLGLIFHFQRLDDKKTRISLYKPVRISEQLLDSIKFLRNEHLKKITMPSDLINKAPNGYGDLLRGIYEDFNTSDFIGMRQLADHTQYEVLCSFSMRNKYKAPFVLIPNSEFFYRKHWAAFVNSSSPSLSSFDFHKFEYEMIFPNYPNANYKNNFLPYLMSSTGLQLLGSVDINNLDSALENQTDVVKEAVLNMSFEPVLDLIESAKKNPKPVQPPVETFEAYYSREERIHKQVKTNSSSCDGESVVLSIDIDEDDLPF